MNTGALWPSLQEAEPRVLAMQAKLHRWAAGDSGRRFDDLYNLVYDPAFLVVAWNRVRINKGAPTAGVDRVAPRDIGPDAGRSSTSCTTISRLAVLLPRAYVRSGSRKRLASCAGWGSRPLATGSCRPC